MEQRQREEQQAASAEQEALERALLDLRCEWKKLKLEYELRRFEEKYRPDQPRDERGRWIDDPDKGSADDVGKEGRDKPSDITDVSAARRGGIPRALWNLTVRQFVSRYCAGQINRELPSQFEGVNIAELLELRKGGDAAADKCYKLLNEPRFRKK